MFARIFRRSGRQGFSSYADDSFPSERIPMTARSFLVLFVSAVCMAIANLLMRGGLLRLEGQISLSLGGMLSLLRQPLYVSGIALVGVAGVLGCRILFTHRLTLSYPLFFVLSYRLIPTD